MVTTVKVIVLNFFLFQVAKENLRKGKRADEKWAKGEGDHGILEGKPSFGAKAA